MKQVLHFILRSVSILKLCLQWPWCGMSCLEPDYYALSIALYRAGKTSWDQGHSFSQYLFSYRKQRTFLLQILYGRELLCSLFLHISHFVLVSSLLSLGTSEVAILIALRTCVLVRFTLFLSCLDKAPVSVNHNLSDCTMGPQQLLNFLEHWSITGLPHCCQTPQSPKGSDTDTWFAILRAI